MIFLIKNWFPLVRFTLLCSSCFLVNLPPSLISDSIFLLFSPSFLSVFHPYSVRDFLRKITIARSKTKRQLLLLLQVSSCPIDVCNSLLKQIRKSNDRSSLLSCSSPIRSIFFNPQSHLITISLVSFFFLKIILYLLLSLYHVYLLSGIFYLKRPIESLSFVILFLLIRFFPTVE